MRAYVLVAVGGAVGAAARWVMGELLDHSPGDFPWATLLVNLAGCALIGLAARHLGRGTDRWMFLVTGVLGGLTTYSTFAAETRDLLAVQRPALALAYVAVSVVGGLVATEAVRRARERA